MLLIPCPYCGERDEIEFAYAGEAHIVRPTNGAEMSDAEWADYLFYRKNTMGVFLEQWSHAAGCRQFFNVARDTRNNEIIKSYKIGETFETTDADNNGGTTEAVKTATDAERESTKDQEAN